MDNSFDQHHPKLKIGVLGAGGIATIPDGVLPNLHHIEHKIELVAIADSQFDRAASAAERFGIPQHFASLTEMLDSSDIDAVVNLTPIPVHAETSLQILNARKHLVVEKPIATRMTEADAIIRAAKAADLTLVCAPPDMLYGPYTEAKRLVEAGTIGKIALARVRSSHAGPGGGTTPWPVDPSWFYADGSGPLFDMGVYGIHEITGILGPAKRVTAFAGITEPFRVVRNGPHRGVQMPVTTADNCLFMLDFGDATFAVIDASYNVHASRSPKLEIFGRRGVIDLYSPDGPNVEIYRTDIAEGLDGWLSPVDWEASSDARRDQLGRAIMVEHLADCIREKRPNALTGEHARHALEIMLAVFQSADEGRTIDLTTSF